MDSFDKLVLLFDVIETFNVILLISSEVIHLFDIVYVMNRYIKNQLQLYAENSTVDSKITPSLNTDIK